MSAIKFKTFDVRPVLARGGEPCKEIRAMAEAVRPGHGLTVIAPFLPAPLIELLKSDGFQSSVERRADGGWTVNFWRE